MTNHNERSEMMTTPTRQTANNNDFLRKAKRVWNAPTYQKASEILNAEGEAATIAYLQQFVTLPVVAYMDDIIAHLDRDKA
jgi:hypothetical protein